MSVPIPTPVYRLTHINNLATCLTRRGIYAPDNSRQDGLQYRCIHNTEAQQRRSQTLEPCSRRNSKTRNSGLAVPPLGCGNGGLDWKVFKPMIVSAFDTLSHPIDIATIPLQSLIFNLLCLPITHHLLPNHYTFANIILLIPNSCC